MAPVHAFSGDSITLEEAMTATMKNQSDILIQKLSIEASKGAKIAAESDFDTNLSASMSVTDSESPLTPTNAKTYGISETEAQERAISFSVSKQMRTGISLSAEATAVQDVDDTYNTPDENTRTLAVTVSVPIYDIISSNSSDLRVQAAEENERAALYNYYQQVTSSLYSTISAWWSYQNNYEAMKLYEEIEQNTLKYLNEFKKLVDADERPKADMIQLEAKYKYAVMETENARNSFISAGYSLCQALGTECGDELPYPALTGYSFEELLEQIDNNEVSIDNRFDMLSAGASLKSTSLLIDALKRDKKHNMSLNFSIKNEEKKEDLFGKSGSDNSGVTFMAEFRVSSSLEKSYTTGQFIQQVASYRQTKLKMNELKRSAQIDVRDALYNLRHAVQSLKISEDTAELYLKALETEKRKLALGMGTVIDVVDTSDSYKNALISTLTYKLKAASAAAKYAYASGRLLNIENGRISINKIFYMNKLSLAGE